MSSGYFARHYLSELGGAENDQAKHACALHNEQDYTPRPADSQYMRMALIPFTPQIVIAQCSSKGTERGL